MGDGERVEPPDGRRLLVWALSSFHAAVLVALVVGGLYFAGVAGNQLAALDTWVGVLAYLYLWGVTWWTNRSMLEGIGGNLVVDRPPPTVLLSAATKWGGLAGLLVFLPALAIGVVLFVGAGGLDAVPFLLFGAAIGAVASTGVGVVVGGVFGLLDLLLLRAVDGWLRSGTVGADSGSGTVR